MRPVTILIVFLLLLSCNTHKDIVKAKFNLGKETKGILKKINSTLYYTIEISPNSLIQKEVVKDLEAKSYKPTKELFDSKGKDYLFNKKPISEIVYDKKGRIKSSKEFRLSKELLVAKKYSYKKNTVLVQISYNRLRKANKNSDVWNDGKRTQKKSYAYSIQDIAHPLGTSEFIYKGKNVTRVIAKDENNHLTFKNVFTYNTEDKIVSDQKSNNQDSILNQIDYKYLNNDKSNIYSTVVKTEDNADFLITKETTYTKKLELPFKEKITEFDKKKQTYTYTNNSYSYELSSDKKLSVLQQKNTVKSSDKHIFYKSDTTYFPDGLMKEFRSTSQFFKEENKNLRYEYDFDASGNWIAKYHYDLSKGGITHILLRTITYH